MPTKYQKHFSTTVTPQAQPIPGEQMVANEAGGYSFPVDDWVRLDRWLIIGAVGNSYYVSERQLTIENADAILRCLAKDGVRTVRRIVETSDAGRAPKNDPAIFALALAAKKGDLTTRQAAFAALPQVCRIGTHVLQFAAMLEAFGGWGYATKKAVGRWYTVPSVDDVAYQLIKYRQRDGWAQRDLLRLSHPKPPNQAYDDLFDWTVNVTADQKEGGKALGLPRIVEGFELAQVTTDPKMLAKVIRDYTLPREAVPTGMLNHVEVWEALLEKMPLTAMIRNLGVMTQRGLLAPLSNAAQLVGERLADDGYLRKARIHPFGLYVALKTYASGHGARGHLTWNPVQSVLDGLDGAFYASFKTVKPTGKRMVVAIDASGSMTIPVMSLANVTVREAASALAFILHKTEPNVVTIGFHEEVVPLDISKAQRVDDVTRRVDAIAEGRGTDCAQPILWAEANKLRVDGFAQYTDGQTWAGQIHPIQALWRYRKTAEPKAKLVSAAMVATGHDIGSKDDAGCLGVQGFDAGTPAVIADFLA